MANVPFQEWIDCAAKGIISTNLDRTFKLEEAAKAHEYMEANKVSSIFFPSFPPVLQSLFLILPCWWDAQIWFAETVLIPWML